MIPMTVAENGEILVVSNICRVVEVTGGTIDVHMANGEILTYTGRAADIIRGQCMLNVSMYQSYLKQLASPIITGANGSGH